MLTKIIKETKISNKTKLLFKGIKIIKIKSHMNQLNFLYVVRFQILLNIALIWEY